ncbi:unnamed protein product [Schistocephalus solidus]|uniref:Secreted protein n=1 Tax=Schistocephalus solidus TaxID=70667 RepID=A0A183TQR7_SCHSO|nr:unnamed protein product [Schistocephalus solidus]
MRSCDRRLSRFFSLFCFSFGSYLKLLLAWAAIMTLDFLMEFRFEYMWPCWLLMRTINDSFKYQGLVSALSFTPTSVHEARFNKGFLPLLSFPRFTS